MKQEGKILMIEQMNSLKGLLSGLFIVLFMLLSCSDIFSQVISNNGAAINITSGAVVEASDASNTNSGILSNNGEFNLSGSYLNTGTTNGLAGYIRLGGNWTNTGGVFVPGSSTVIFRGSDDQVVTKSGGETFFNFILQNSGASTGKRVVLGDNADVLGTLTMSAGNIDPGTFILYLTNPAASALSYISTTKSRITGRFRRAVSEQATYLFPLGTAANYNPANLRTNTLTSGGNILSQFLTTPPGNGGLPLSDPPMELFETYNAGFWRMISGGGFSSSDFNIDLTAEGFVDTVWSVTRLVRRNNTGNWVVDGAHRAADTTAIVVYRDNLTGDISAAGTDFALARPRPLITDHPNDTAVCETFNTIFRVTASGAKTLKYRWYKDGVPINNGPHYSGARTNTLTIIGTTLADAGDYYCIVTDRHRNSTTSNSAYLHVSKVPVTTITPADQLHECSDIDFQDIIMGLSHWDVGTTFIWRRDNPAGLTSALPLNGTAAMIGDRIEGMFSNSLNHPVKVTFTIWAVGPAPTACIGDSLFASVTINPVPVVNVSTLLSQICFGAATSIQLTTPTTMTAGQVMFDYTVSVTGLPGQITGNIAPAVDLLNGHTIVRNYNNNSDTINSVRYSITPKNNSLTCNAGNIVIPRVKVHPKPLQSLFISVPFTCGGGAAGELTAILSRGSKPDILRWYDRPWVGDTTYTSTNNVSTIDVRFEGYYNLRVTDSLGCLNQISLLKVEGAKFSTSLIAVDTSGYGTTCPGSNDGEIRIWEGTSTTAIAPFQYWLVYNGSDTLRNGTIAGVGPSFYVAEKNLPSGQYMLIIKDFNGCTNINYPRVDIIDPPLIDVNFGTSDYNGYDVSCTGYNDASVWVAEVTGGNYNPRFRYKWTTIDGMISTPDTLDRLDNIPSGTYVLRTTDRKGCFTYDTIIITQPLGMSLDSYDLSSSADLFTNISCAGGSDGSISLVVSGGSGNYTYAWTDGDEFTSSNRDINNLKAGTYIVTIRDQSGCELRILPASTLPTFILTEPSPLHLNAVPSLATDGINDISCNGGTGTLDMTVTGGSPTGYTYNWTTTNGSGIVQGDPDQNALTAGTYLFGVTDYNGCIKDTTITLTQPDALELTLTPTHITCDPPGFSNGSINLNVAGGATPYATYSWSNGATTQNISGLTAGNYSVTVTDLNGCTKTESVMVNLPAPLLYTKSVSNYNGFSVSCFGSTDGSINITPTSGLSPYIYTWQRIGDTFTATTEDLNNIPAGEYMLTIEDANNCVQTEIIELTQPGKALITFTLSSSIAGGFNINCFGDTTATINVVPVNMVDQVNYIWSDGSTLQNRINMASGDYELVITDENGCTADTVISLTEPEQISLVLTVFDPFCQDMPDGRIDLEVTGGVPGADYQYLWSDNSTSQNLTDIPSGRYRVVVTDLNGCIARDSVRVSMLNESCLIIPNAISPNGDLINDEWNIGNINLYPEIEIRIFNRWGETIWRSAKGYPEPWNGTSNGKPMPIDSYHYIIDLNKGRKPVVGNITIVK